MVEPESRYFFSGRLRLHYLVWGDEAKPPLVMVHGGRDNCRTWDFVARALLDDYAVYALDLRGHGDSDWSTGGDYRISDYVRDLAGLVEAIGREKVSILGHSTGGRVTLDYSGAFPERVERMVVIEGYGWPMWRDKPAPERLRDYVTQAQDVAGREPHVYPTLAAAAERLFDANKRLTPALVEHLTRHAVRPFEGGYVWKFDKFVYLRPPPDLSVEEAKAVWRRIQAPGLHVWGDSSFLQFPLREELGQALPHSRSVTFENAGHWVHHDRLDDFVALTRDFLAGKD